MSVNRNHARNAVDAVITWVDGYDEAHRKKLADYLRQHGMARPETAASTRYNQHDEITYCVRSILKFAPWIRNIYIVTDGQKPPVIDDLHSTPGADKIKLVDHQHIFRGYESYLPTFNSLTIASMLWRIEELADRFICFCDDFSIIRPVSPDDFFRGNKTVLRGQWKTHYEQYWYRKWVNALGKYRFWPARPSVPNDHRHVQENAARMVGYDRRLFYVPHVPFPLKKETLARYFEENPEYLTDNIAHPFRSREQFEIITLAHHLEIIQKQAIIDNHYFEVTVNPAHHPFAKITKKLSLAARNDCVKFVCVQSIDEATPETRTYLLNWLDERIKA
ncbi:Stealth CR1 domain-containing protein [Legionella spiritensis]|uniref:Capsular polysaccharide phosphotransferase cps12A n=1 Tax=Legionella spiritensis TaxID=452 RepID=A0A0W0Z5F9_LEGSP|nr:Stealth CR1 domain-containing protein [Legionella spiritensis]KTD64321.1 Capsular polysaccharide phosphotransferase cps12A [Legionella spiritensis]SNV46612.1 Capsular polysaccharide phosphotransferase SacB [Legionella spiritensis]